jgi:hypothetical protein
MISIYIIALISLLKVVHLIRTHQPEIEQYEHNNRNSGW